MAMKISFHIYFKQLKMGVSLLKKNGNSNPYLAIYRKMRKEATILFSESKLSDYTLKKIISSSKFRSKLMQKSILLITTITIIVLS